MLHAAHAQKAIAVIARKVIAHMHHAAHARKATAVIAHKVIARMHHAAHARKVIAVIARKVIARLHPAAHAQTVIVARHQAEYGHHLNANVRKMVFHPTTDKKNPLRRVFYFKP